MNKNINEIIDYINECPNCYSAILNSQQQFNVQFIKYKKAFEKMIILGVSKNDVNPLEASANANISIAIWNKIEGYQVKGHQISKEDEGKYENEMMSFKNELIDEGADISAIKLVLCNINEIYNVTPGKFAGKLQFGCVS